MKAYFSSDIASFASASADEITAVLHSKYAADGFCSQYTSQTEAWNVTIPKLQEELRILLRLHPSSKDWYVLLECPLYRLRRRIDVLVLTPAAVVVIELKVGASRFLLADQRQVEEYALDLRDFHAASLGINLVPVLWCTEAETVPYTLIFEPGDVASVFCIGGSGLAEFLGRTGSSVPAVEYPLDEWESGQYRPVPTVISAATALFAGHGVREIAQSDAINLEASAKRVIEIIQETRQSQARSLVFLAGVPGSGKTLAGLQVVHGAVESGVEDKGDIIYLSGNTPLVVVLREALARDEAERRKLRKERPGLAQARSSVRTRIQDYRVPVPLCADGVDARDGVAAGAACRV